MLLLSASWSTNSPKRTRSGFSESKNRSNQVHWTDSESQRTVRTEFTEQIQRVKEPFEPSSLNRFRESKNCSNRVHWTDSVSQRTVRTEFTERFRESKNRSNRVHWTDSESQRTEFIEQIQRVKEPFEPSSLNRFRVSKNDSFTNLRKWTYLTVNIITEITYHRTRPFKNTFLEKFDKILLTHFSVERLPKSVTPEQPTGFLLTTRWR